MGVCFESPAPNSVPLWNRVTTEPGHPYTMIWSSANSTSRESPSGPRATISKVSSGASLYCPPQGSRENVKVIERELHTRNEVTYSLVSGSPGMPVTSAAGVRRPIASQCRRGARRHLQLDGLQGMGQGVVIQDEQNQVHNALVAQHLMHGVKRGVGNLVRGQQLFGEAHHFGVVTSQAVRSGAVADGIDDRIGHTLLPGQPLMGRPHIVIVGLP